MEVTESRVVPVQQVDAPEMFAPSPTYLNGRERFDFVDLLVLLSRRKRTVLRFTLIVAVTATVISLFLPDIYTAESVILPPQQQNQSLAASMLGQLAPLVSLAGKDIGAKTTSEMYVAILKSRSVADALVQRYELVKVYGSKTVTDAREELAKSSDIVARKDGAITISVEDRDRKRAAALANGYVEELAKLNRRLAVTEASRRRLFFEGEARTAKENLTKAELELQRTQERSGLIQLDGQSRAIIEAVAMSRAQVAAKELQLASMRTVLTEQNPDLKRAHQELTTLRAQLDKLEQGQIEGNGDPQLPTGKVPAAGSAFIQKLRDVKYTEAIFELLSKQYELAKVDESRDAAVIQVLDNAVEPERKSRPKRSLIVLLSTLVGALLSMTWVFVHFAVERWRTTPANSARLDTIRIHH